MAGRLVLLCHHGGWDRTYQAASAAVSAATSGQRVDVVWFFDALVRLAEDRMDEVTLHPRDAEAEARLRERSGAVGTRPVSELWAAARATGEARFWACSASIALTGVDEDSVRERVDEVVGWPTVVRMMGEADHALYL